VVIRNRFFCHFGCLLEFKRSLRFNTSSG